MSDNPNSAIVPGESNLNVFMTGGSDPVGLALTRQLVAAGHRVIGMTDGSEGASRVREAGGLPVFADPARAGEIRGMLVMAKANVVIHAAPMIANAVPFATWDYPPEQLTEETCALIEAVREAEVQVERVLHFSYALVYALAGDTSAPAGEGDELAAPDDPFLAAALETERLMQDELSAVVLRAGYIYGPDSEALRALDARLKGGAPIPTGSASAANWVYQDDLLKAAGLALDQSGPAVFNIVDDRPTAPAEFLHYLATAQGLNPPASPPRLLGGLFADRLVMDRLDLSARASNTHARQQLGWKPAFPTYKDGLENVLRSWRAEMSQT